MSKRRRSAFVGVSILTLSAAALAGCGKPAGEERPIFTSVAECKAKDPAANCEAALQAAQAEHDKAAPRFNDRAACEQDWGQGRCEQRTDAGGHVSFLPIMAGFMLGQALASRGPGYQPGYAANGCPPGQTCNGGGGGYGGRAVYVGSRGGLFAGRDRIGEAEARGGRFFAPSSARVTEAPGGRLSGVTRGGFGRSAGFHAGRGG